MAVQTVLSHRPRMTSTTTFGGFNPEGRSSSKVLKPPGGGSSDIFGTSGGSNESAATPARRVKNHQQSNLFLSDEPQMTPSRNQNDGTHNGQNGHSEETVNANPVVNGNAAPIMNGNTQPAPAPAQRQRVPPGGFSSGLW